MTRILHFLFALILSLTAAHLALAQTSNTTEAGVSTSNKRPEITNQSVQLNNDPEVRNRSVSKDKFLASSSNVVIADPLVRMLIAKGVLRV